MNSVMLIFFAVLAAAVILYYAMPIKYRWIVLLSASIIFYAIVSTYLIAFIAVTILTVYFGARQIQRNNDKTTD